MRTFKTYAFELCWLAVVLLLYAAAPARTSAQTFSFEEAAADCPEISGWCADFF